MIRVKPSSWATLNPCPVVTVTVPVKLSNELLAI